jgi:magnesium-transporting ATPase (P-type)
MTTWFKRLAAWKTFGLLILSAVVLSLLSYFMLYLRYGVFDWGDSDFPPYQPETLIEKAFEAICFFVLFGAGLLWLFVISYVIALLFRAIKRRVA